MNEKLSRLTVDAVDAASQQSYEELPYPNLFFADTHPDKLATVAAMYGMSPAPPSRCRVLELGSASGANLMPMAEYLRDSTFVGIDRTGRQIDAGKARVAELGLSNIQLLQQDLMDVTPQLGTFDYIICHGVYTWVPVHVQRKILDICRENLAPQGVAYISYNTYPGWKMREMVRDTVLYRAKSKGDPLARVAEARKMLHVIRDGLGKRTDPYAVYMRAEIAHLDEVNDSYMAHEYLEGFNQPCYFHEFVDRAREAKLMFVSEVDATSALGEELSPETRASLHDLGGPLDREQYRDFLRNTRFRKSLLCHEGVKLQTDYNPERFCSLYFTSPLQPGAPVNLDNEVESAFVHGKMELKTKSALVKSAVLAMAEAAPQRLAFAVLLSATLQRLATIKPVDPQRRALPGVRCWKCSSAGWCICTLGRSTTRKKRASVRWLDRSRGTPRRRASRSPIFSTNACRSNRISNG